MPTEPTTLFLSRADIAAAVPVGEALDLLAEGFRTDGTGGAPPRARADRSGPSHHAGRPAGRSHQAGRGGADRSTPGLLSGVPACAARQVGTFPALSPTPREVVHLRDPDTGAPLAVLDAAGVTAWGTGLAAALATHTLAGPRATTLGLVGTGARARAALAGLRHLRRWERIVATDRDPAGAAALPATPLPDVATVLAEADAVVLATSAPRPPLRPADVRPGQHLSSLGGYGRGRWELAPALLTGGRLIVDDVDAAMERGALGSAGLNASHCDGTLGQVLRGEVAAHPPADRPSLYAATGLPWQDLVLSWVVYRRALALGLGTRSTHLQGTCGVTDSRTPQVP